MRSRGTWRQDPPAAPAKTQRRALLEDPLESAQLTRRLVGQSPAGLRRGSPLPRSPNSPAAAHGTARDYCLERAFAPLPDSPARLGRPLIYSERSVSPGRIRTGDMQPLTPRHEAFGL